MPKTKGPLGPFVIHSMTDALNPQAASHPTEQALPQAQVQAQSRSPPALPAHRARHLSA